MYFLTKGRKKLTVQAPYFKDSLEKERILFYRNRRPFLGWIEITLSSNSLLLHLLINQENFTNCPHSWHFTNFAARACSLSLTCIDSSTTCSLIIWIYCSYCWICSRSSAYRSFCVSTCSCSTLCKSITCFSLYCASYSALFTIFYSSHSLSFNSLILPILLDWINATLSSFSVASWIWPGSPQSLSLSWNPPINFKKNAIGCSYSNSSSPFTSWIPSFALCHFSNLFSNCFELSSSISFYFNSSSVHSFSSFNIIKSLSNSSLLLYIFLKSSDFIISTLSSLNFY